MAAHAEAGDSKVLRTGFSYILRGEIGYERPERRFSGREVMDV